LQAEVNEHSCCNSNPDSTLNYDQYSPTGQPNDSERHQNRAERQ